jgi:hypothetical protein
VMKYQANTANTPVEIVPAANPAHIPRLRFTFILREPIRLRLRYGTTRLVGVDWKRLVAL